MVIRSTSRCPMAPGNHRGTPDAVYPTTEGWARSALGGLIAKGSAASSAEAALELIPAGLRAGLGWPRCGTPLLEVHRPSPQADTALLALGRHPAQRRLAFEGCWRSTSA